MKKWKIIRIIAILFLIAFIIGTIILAIKIYSSNYSYPYVAFDCIKINNWIDEFRLEFMMLLYLFGISFIIDIFFLILSTIKIKKYKSINNNNKNKK